MKIGILVDSCATPTPKIFEGTVIEILPLHINLMTGEDFLDIQANYDKYKVVDLIERGDSMKTSQASPGEVETKYDEMLSKYDHIVHIPITNNLSSMLQTAVMVSKDEKFQDKVTVFINEEITATVIEKAALLINERIKNGEYTSPQQIIAFLEDYSKSSVMLFLPGDLKRLNAAGRTKKVLANVLSLIKAKVVLRWAQTPTKEGIFRTYKAVVERAIEVYEKEVGKEFHFLFVRSERFAEKGLEIIRNTLKAKKISYEEQMIPTIYLVHAGIDSLAFLFCKKK